MGTESVGSGGGRVPERESAWSAGDYTARAIRPHLRAGAAAAVPLHVRYDLDDLIRERAADDAVLQRVADVVALWQRQAQGGTTAVRTVCRRWLHLDATLREELGSRYNEAAWWRAHVAVDPPPRGPGRGGTAVAAPEPAATVGAQPAAEEPAPSDEEPVPFDVQVAITAGGVDLSWTPPPDTSRETRYTVERLASGSGERRIVAGHLTGTRLRDEDAPVAEQLWYLVVAEGRPGEPSRLGRTTAWFDPPVEEFEVYAESPGQVRGIWRPHADCGSVRIWRTAGREPVNPDDGVPVAVPESSFQFTDTPGVVGEVSYHIAPVYQHKLTGRPVIGRRTTVDVTLRPPPPAPALTGTTVAELDGRVLFRARWEPMPLGAQPKLLRAWDGTPAVTGKVLSDRLLPRLGDELTPVLTAGGPAQYQLPAGRSRLLPVAVADGLATFGADVEVVHVPRLIDLQMTRADTWVRATWRWPHQVQVAALVWEAAGRRVPKTVTDVRLRDNGGYVQFEDPGPVTLTAVAEMQLPGRGTLRSAEETASAPPAPLILTFVVTRRCYRTDWWRVVRFTASRDCTGIAVRVWLHQAGTPAEDDRAIGEHAAVACGPGRTFDVTVRLPHRPKRTRGTWYARCEAWDDDGEVVVDNFNSRREVR